jgi:hypothetical protein
MLLTVMEILASDRFDATILSGSRQASLGRLANRPT